MRISLRTILVVVAVVAIVVACFRAIWLEPLREEGKSIAAIKSRAAVVNNDALHPPTKERDQIGGSASRLGAKSPLANPRGDFANGGEGLITAPEPFATPSPTATTIVGNDSLAQLKTLLLGSEANTKVTSISFLESLHGASDKDLEIIAHIPSVERLDLTYRVQTPIHGGWRGENLGAPLVTDAGIEWLRRLPHLREVNMSRANVSDMACEILADCPSIEHVSIVGTRVSDTGLLRFAKSRSMKSISVTESNVTAAGVERLLQARPDIRVWGP